MIQNIQHAARLYGDKDLLKSYVPLFFELTILGIVPIDYHALQYYECVPLVNTKRRVKHKKIKAVLERPDTDQSWDYGVSAETSFFPGDLFTLDVDVEKVSLPKGGAYAAGGRGRTKLSD
jgi:hypothetical protein